MIRGGHHLGDKNFYPKNAEEHSDEEVIEAFIAQHYLRHGIPRQIIAGVKIDTGPLEEALSTQAGRKVQITTNPIGARRTWLEMAWKNARLGAEQTVSFQSTQEARAPALPAA